jgi:DNA-binding MarR family transcriptional regulator
MLRLPQYEVRTVDAGTVFRVIEDREPGRDGAVGGAETASGDALAGESRPAGERDSGGGAGSPADDSAGDETLSEAFWSVARQMRGTSQEALAPWDINPSYLRALRMLNRHGAMRLSELSDHLHIAPRSATEVVDALETRGLAERRPDPGDRRATLVELTEHGTDVLGAIRGSEAERVFGRLSERDRAELARILRELRD